MPSGAMVRPHAIFTRTVQSHAYRPNLVLPHVFSTPPSSVPVSVQMERLGPAPRPGLVFIPGYYFWNEGPTEGFVWIDPVWAVPPVPGAVWIDPKWAYQDNDQWALQEGYWQEPGNMESQDVQQLQTPDDGPCFGHYRHPGCPDVQDGAVSTDPVPQQQQPQQQQLPEYFTPEELHRPAPPITNRELVSNSPDDLRAMVAPPQPVLKSVPIANTQLVIQPFTNTWYRLTIGNESEVRVVGEFSTNSSYGVQANINDGKQKGRKTLYYWSAPPSMSGSLDVRLSPGTYFLTFNNPGDQQILVNVNVSLSIRQ